MFKKIVIAGFMTVLCAALFAQNVASDFAINSDGVIIKYEGWDAAVVIPETVNGIRVTAIGANAFASSDLTSVTIPRGVISIGASAFSRNKLTSVTIPDSVTSIGNNAFNGNPLTSVTLGSNHIFNTSIVSQVNSTTSNLFYDYVCNDRKGGTYTANRGIGTAKREGDFQYLETQYGAFITGYTGSSGNRLIIPSMLANLPVKALSGLRGIIRVQIPDSVTYIANDAFNGSRLTSVTIPDSVTHIGNNAFWDNQLTSVTIGNSVTHIGNEAFMFNRLTDITIGNSVTYIGNSAFSSNQLTSVTIPNGVTYIGYMAFRENRLTSVTIPDGVTIGDEAFDNRFNRIYNDNGRAAGTYTRPNDSSGWTKQ